MFGAVRYVSGIEWDDVLARVQLPDAPSPPPVTPTRCPLRRSALRVRVKLAYVASCCRWGAVPIPGALYPHVILRSVNQRVSTDKGAMTTKRPLSSVHD